MDIHPSSICKVLQAKDLEREEKCFGSPLRTQKSTGREKFKCGIEREEPLVVPTSEPTTNIRILPIFLMENPVANPKRLPTVNCSPTIDVKVLWDSDTIISLFARTMAIHPIRWRFFYRQCGWYWSSREGPRDKKSSPTELLPKQETKVEPITKKHPRNTHLFLFPPASTLHGSHSHSQQ